MINAVGASVRRIRWLATKKLFMDVKSRTNARYAPTPQVKKVYVELAELLLLLLLTVYYLLLLYRQYVVEYRMEGSVRFLLCTHCPKRFKKPLDLVRHLRIHNSIMPYKVIVLFMIECRHFSSATFSFYSAQSVSNPSVL